MKSKEIKIRVVLSALIIIMIVNYSYLGGIFLVFLVVLLGYSFGPLVALLLGKKSATLFTGYNRQTKEPSMGRGLALKKQRQYQNSFEEFLSIQEQFPGYIPVYLELFSLAFEKLEYYEKAKDIYKQGLKSMTKADKIKLKMMYQNFNNEALNDPSRHEK